VPPLDPAQVVGRGMGLAQAYQQTQLGQMKLAEAEREDFERQNLGAAVRGTMRTDPQTGQQTPNLPGALSRAYQTSRDPLSLLKVETAYKKSQAETGKSALEARKTELETLQKQTEYVSGLANGVLAVEAQGGDVQQAYQAAIQQAAQVLGPDQIRGLPPTYDRSVVTRFAAQGQKYTEALQAEQQRNTTRLREYELAETQKRTAIEREGLGIRRQEVTARREETVERRAEREQQRATQGSARTFEQEDKLRNDFIAQTKPYQVQSDFYGRIETAAKDPSAAGDLALIYSFMKLLDPGSTVLAGEYATAANAGSIPERIYSQYNRLLSGELLGDAEKGTIRKDYIDRARRIYEQSTKDYQRTKAVFDDRARRYHLDPANVTQDLGTTAERPTDAPAPAAPAAPAAGRTITEADIEATIKDSVTAGRPVTRQQVIDAAKRKGWQTP
jgi:hypothetical protein